MNFHTMRKTDIKHGVLLVSLSGIPFTFNPSPGLGSAQPQWFAVE
jgi:hypothetical protein